MHRWFLFFFFSRQETPAPPKFVSTFLLIFFVAMCTNSIIVDFSLAARYHVSEGTLRCLSSLPLRIREDERARAKARVKSKNRKRRREGSVEAGLMEADARVDDDVRAKCQADALHEVHQYSSRVGAICCTFVDLCTSYLPFSDGQGQGRLIGKRYDGHVGGTGVPHNVSFPCGPDAAWGHVLSFCIE